VLEAEVEEEADDDVHQDNDVRNLFFLDVECPKLQEIYGVCLATCLQEVDVLALIGP